MDDYLIKPFDIHELLVRVNNLLRNYQQRQEALSEKIEEEGLVLSVSEEKEISWLQSVETVALQSIKERPEQFSVANMADRFELSERQFRRKIKTLVGLNPNQYLRELKLKVAKDYLEQKRYATISEVAKAVGFNNSNHFMKLYEDRFGKSPIQYLE